MTDKPSDFQQFAELTFEDFRRLAADVALSDYQKIGFPHSYREGYEEHIFEDIRRKLPVLSERRRLFVDIGPGCSELPRLLLGLAAENEHEAVLIDSAEMLGHLPDRPGVHKINGAFPDCWHALAPWKGQVDAILCYSVLHYIIIDANLFEFLDRALELLAPGGAFLIGDIPNTSMRRRFLDSDEGRRFAEAGARLGAPAAPDTTGRIDDAVVLSLVMRVRGAGFHAFVLPQPPSLPMANRREDLLIVRPR